MDRRRKHSPVSEDCRKKAKVDPEPGESDELLTLLEFESVKDDEDVKERYQQIARSLFFKHQIYLRHKGKTTTYELLEIEFYWNNHSWHPDPFCHAGPRNFCEWHFHKAPRRTPGPAASPKSLPTAAGGFRGGTRKGLDLTIGGKPDPADITPDHLKPSGGVLLRSMRRLEDGHVISGPSLLVDEVLHVFEAVNLNTLVTTIWSNNLFALNTHSDETRSCMYLGKGEETVASGGGSGGGLGFYTSPRIGLDLSNPAIEPIPSDPRVAFVAKFHRFFRHPELLTSNGRLQTFIGLVRHLQQQKTTDATRATLLISVGKFSSKSVEKYTTDFRGGEETGKLEQFTGLAGKTTSPNQFMRLMGTLHRLGLL